MGTALVRTPKIDSEFACFGMEIRPSKIHRFGVYATQRIPAKKKVIEYRGERCNRIETNRRGMGKHTYLFTLDNYWTLDGAVGGSGAEIINHCCEPNLISRIIKGHILYFSLRDIKPGEELTIDYHFSYSGDHTKCSCGAAKCRGEIELPREPRKPKKDAKAPLKKSEKKAVKKTAGKQVKATAKASPNGSEPALKRKSARQA